MLQPKNFNAYVQHLQAVHRAIQRGDDREQEVAAALDGESARIVRAVVSSRKRKELGAFFTSSALRSRVWSTFKEPLPGGAVVVDPAVGAGDLLLGALERVHHQGGVKLVGFDLHNGFVEAARARLSIARATLFSASRGDTITASIRTGSGLVQRQALAAATHVVVNPPFSPKVAPRDCRWASGRVNEAAIFLDVIVEQGAAGVEIVAIVPDVLRSGANYARWRKHIADRAEILSVQRAGRFDAWTDVDVVILHLKKRPTPASKESADWGSLAGKQRGGRVCDRFSVSVGSVVDYRSPKEGPWCPYLVARTAPAWGSIRTIDRHRRFDGALFVPPFVAIRRTSSPSDRHRAVATIVQGAEAVAVENHLLVAQPLDGRLSTCRALLEHLAKPSTDRWFNRKMACRHLTVGAVRDLPWRT